MPQRSSFTRIVVLLTIAFCISLALNLFPILRGDMPGMDTTYDWVWDYSPPRWLWVIPCIFGIALYLVIALHLLSQDKEWGYPTRLILCAFIGAALLPILLMTLEGRPLFLLFTRSASTLTGGYQDSITLINDFSTTLRTWPDFMADYRAKIPVGGLPLSPPGLVALYYGVNRLFDAVPAAAQSFATLVRPLECQNLEMMSWTDSQMASGWLQILMPLWSALAVAPLYKLGASVFNRNTARWTVALWPLLPTIALFMPRFNSFYPLLTLLLLIFLWRGLERHSYKWIVLTGFVVSVATFMNLTLTPLGLLAGLTIIGHWIKSGQVAARSSLIRVVTNILVFGLGVLSVWAIYTLLSGVSPLAILQTSMRFHTQIQRPYFPWLLMHPYDTFLFVGLPITALFLWRISRIRRLSTNADLFTLAAVATLLIMVFSGTARGETGRVWSFFAPLWLLVACDQLTQANFRWGEKAALCAAQALYLLVLAAFLRVNFTSLTIPPTVADAPQPASIPVNAQFSQGRDSLTLVGFTGETATDSVRLHLYWRADSPISRPYSLSAVPVPPDGSYRQGVTWNPLDWEYPPTCWLPGQTFVDTVTIPYGEQRIPGGWWFSIAVNDQVTNVPMQVRSNTQVTTQIGIGPVRVD